MPETFVQPPVTPPLTPGAYLKHRRQAALLTPADVAARIATEPRVGLHLLAEQIELIEADAQPASFSTIVALHRVIAFDLAVLARLVAIAMGYDYDAPRLCRICASNDRPGLWKEADLCSCCASLATPSTIGDAA